MSLTNYAHYLYTLKNNYIGDFLCRSVAVYALMKTVDNYYVFCEMSKHTTFPGAIQCIAPAIDINDIDSSNRINLRYSMQREILEETSLDIFNPKICSNLSERYIITRNNNAHLAICFDVNLNYKKNEVQDIFDEFYLRDINSNEVSNLIFVKNNKESIVDYLNKNRYYKDYIHDLLLTDHGEKLALDNFLFSCSNMFELDGKTNTTSWYSESSR